MELEYSLGCLGMDRGKLPANWASKAPEFFDDPSERPPRAWTGGQAPLLALAGLLERNSSLFESLARREYRDWSGEGFIQWVCDVGMTSVWKPQGGGTRLTLVGDPYLAASLEALSQGRPVTLYVHPDSFVAPFFRAMTLEASFEHGNFLLYPYHLPIKSSLRFADPAQLTALEGKGMPSRIGASMIVLDSADLDSALEASLKTTFLRSAQHSVFTAPRLWVQESVYDTFLAKMTKKLSSSSWVVCPTKDTIGVDAVQTPQSRVRLQAFASLPGVEVLCNEGPPLVISPSPLVDTNEGLILFLSSFRTSKELLSLLHPSLDEPVFIFSEDLSSALELVNRLDKEVIYVNTMEENRGYVRRGCFPNAVLFDPKLTKEALEVHFREKKIFSIDDLFNNASKALGPWRSCGDRERQMLKSLGSLDLEEGGEYLDWMSSASMGLVPSSPKNLTAFDFKGPVGIVSILSEIEEPGLLFPLVSAALSQGNVVLLATRFRMKELSSLSDGLDRGVLQVVELEDVGRIAPSVVLRRDMGLTVYMGKSPHLAAYLRAKAAGRVWVAEPNFSKDAALQWVTRTKRVTMAHGTIFAN